MNESGNQESQSTAVSSVAETRRPPPVPTSTAGKRKSQRRESRRWWIKLFLQPALLLVCGAILFIGLGVAQRLGFLSAGGGQGHSHAASNKEVVRYICPMMCTPAQSEPGRCPVCAMELVPATSGAAEGDSRSIQIDPAARRIANIQTVAVKSMPVTRTIRAIGEFSYNEGSLKTISAYVDGRLDRLYADYTGVVVEKGDHLAWVYSPRLYSSQVEYLLARKARVGSRSSTLVRVTKSNQDLYESARRRLIELGMTPQQIDELDKTGKANSRLHLCAPNSGTVIEKLAVEGQYVKEGEAIYKLADLSSLWLMLQLFPEDAAMIRNGQQVEAEVQSLPGRKFAGRVAFVDPRVDPKTRTVGVRVVVANPGGLLRVGDYAKAMIRVPVGSGNQQEVYEPELAKKWIGPRHPHGIESSPGKCRLCGTDLVPPTEFGFTASHGAEGDALVVPRDAVLMAGDHSVLYVETEPGRFEIRPVTLGASCGDEVVVLSGVEEGEQVATRGNFLIDSQMQLVGNPSLIDPTKARPPGGEETTAEMFAGLSKLSPEDRRLAERQRICPVAEYKLGAMGPPTKVDVNGTPVFICCEGCRESLLAEPEKYLAKLQRPAASEDFDGSDAMDLPPLGTPELVEPQSGLPPITAPQPITKGSTERDISDGEPRHPVIELPMDTMR